MVTKKDMVIAIALSEFHKKSHVMFIEKGFNYRKMLLKVRSLGYCEPVSKESLNGYVLTEKGWNYLATQSIEGFTFDMEKEVADFIDNL